MKTNANLIVLNKARRQTFVFLVGFSLLFTKHLFFCSWYVTLPLCFGSLNMIF